MNHDKFHKLGFRFLEEIYQILSFERFHFGPFGNRRAHGDFENIFAF